MSDQTTPAVEATQEQQSVQLQLSDILVAAQSIQLASTRGAFRAEEFTQIGGCYERLVAFLQSTGALQQPTGASAAPTSGDTVAPPATE
jgi:hypothetical protein